MTKRPSSLPGTPIVVLLALGMAACGGTRSTVGDGLIQKRRHQPGWHVDLGGRAEVRSVPRRAMVDPEAPLPVAVRMQEHRSMERSVQLPGPSQQAAPPHREPVASTKLLLEVIPLMKEQGIPADTAREGSRASISDPPRRWNPWSVPAFAAAAGTVALALTTGTSTVLVILALILTLALASIALRRGRKNEWSGKGFAIAAMMIGSLAALITLVALVSGGA